MRNLLNSKAGAGEPKRYDDFILAAEIRIAQIDQLANKWQGYEETRDVNILKELASQTRDRLGSDLKMHKALHEQLDRMTNRVKDMDVEFGQQARKDITTARNTLMQRGNEQQIHDIYEKLDAVIKNGQGTPQQEAFRRLIPQSLNVMGASMGAGVAADHWLARIEELKKAWDFLSSQNPATSQNPSAVANITHNGLT